MVRNPDGSTSFGPSLYDRVQQLGGLEGYNNYRRQQDLLLEQQGLQNQQLAQSNYNNQISANNQSMLAQQKLNTPDYPTMAADPSSQAYEWADDPDHPIEVDGKPVPTRRRQLITGPRQEAMMANTKSSSYNNATDSEQSKNWRAEGDQIQADERALIEMPLAQQKIERPKIEARKADWLARNPAGTSASRVAGASPKGGSVQVTPASGGGNTGDDVSSPDFWITKMKLTPAQAQIAAEHAKAKVLAKKGPGEAPIANDMSRPAKANMGRQVNAAMASKPVAGIVDRVKSNLSGIERGVQAMSAVAKSSNPTVTAPAPVTGALQRINPPTNYIGPDTVNDGFNQELGEMNFRQELPLEKMLREAEERKAAVFSNYEPRKSMFSGY